MTQQWDRVTARRLADAVWRHRTPDIDGAELCAVLALARRNQVEGALARAYPRQLAETLDEVRAATAQFVRNLNEVAARLGDAGVPAVLIKAEPGGDYVYGNFDLVVRESDWRTARAALSGWYVRAERYWLERSSKVLLEPQLGPAAHLHRCVSWFGVPVIPNERLFASAVPAADGAWLLPGRADALRIWLAHALFQNLEFDLSELASVHRLIDAETVAEAREQAEAEGWLRGGAVALATAMDGINALDAGKDVRLPLPLPLSASGWTAVAHPARLLRTGHARKALRSAALRGPLVVAKWRGRSREAKEEARAR